MVTQTRVPIEKVNEEIKEITQYHCRGCVTKVSEEDLVWLTREGKKLPISSSRSYSWHPACVPTKKTTKKGESDGE